MADNFFEALREIFSIQRWNFVPRVDEWSEAENIAYYSHLAYAISLNLGFSREKITKLLYRCLLKSFNKHRLSDIPISSRDAIRAKDVSAWEKTVDDAAKITANFFPRELRIFIEQQMQFHFREDNPQTLPLEDIIKYCQYRSAWEECDSNWKAFPIRKYEKIRGEICTKMSELQSIEILKKEYSKIEAYAEEIKILKYVRRWNRLPRNIQSSVMAHSFMVALLSLFFSCLEKENEEDFKYECMIRGLFHDVPESITGDIISPVKDIINKDKPKLWEEVEESMLSEFEKLAPQKLQDEIKRLNLLKLSSNPPLGSSESLVKECDKFALVLECAFERRSGNQPAEMMKAHSRYLDELRNSEWPRIREYVGRIVDEYPIKNSE